MIYLDCNATTPVEPEVLELMIHYMKSEFGNAGSRTHRYGSSAAAAVRTARSQVARVVECDDDDVVFTSGATEANNLAILGLEAFGRERGRMHIVSTSIEHKAVLEPLQRLQARGFTVDLVAADRDGAVSAADVIAKIRPDTLLVSVMHANNETGMLQPVGEIANAMAPQEAFLHVDAAQSYGKVIEDLRCPRIDLLSVSAHKIYGPKGVGCLIVKKRNFKRVPLQPLMVGGGQERGLRPGTLPVPLIAGFGEASRLALKDHAKRAERNRRTLADLLGALPPIAFQLNSVLQSQLPNVANVTFRGIDSEALMVVLKDQIACSNGAACTSHSYEKSHVLRAMGLDDQAIASTLRLSWCHLTEKVDWSVLTRAVERASAVR